MSFCYGFNFICVSVFCRKYGVFYRDKNKFKKLRNNMILMIVWEDIKLSLFISIFTILGWLDTFIIRHIRFRTTFITPCSFTVCVALYRCPVHICFAKYRAAVTSFKVTLPIAHFIFILPHIPNGSLWLSCLFQNLKFWPAAVLDKTLPIVIWNFCRIVDTCLTWHSICLRF